jgi:hypothetical protein
MMAELRCSLGKMVIALKSLRKCSQNCDAALKSVQKCSQYDGRIAMQPWKNGNCLKILTKLFTTGNKMIFPAWTTIYY